MAKSKNRKSRHSGVVAVAKKEPPTAGEEYVIKTGAEYAIGTVILLVTTGLFFYLLYGLVNVVLVGGFCERYCQYFSEDPWSVGYSFVVLSFVLLALGSASLTGLKLLLNGK